MGLTMTQINNFSLHVNKLEDHRKKYFSATKFDMQKLTVYSN